MYLSNLVYPAKSTNVCDFADGAILFSCNKDSQVSFSRLEIDVESFNANT